MMTPDAVTPEAIGSLRSATRTAFLIRLIHSFKSPRTLPVGVLLGIVLSLPFISSGLVLDDYQQRIALLSGAWHNVFEFFPHDWTVAEMQRGTFPWWFHPQLRLSFFRPVAQWSMELDYRLWPDNFALMHLHSVLWYGLLVLLAGLAYRRIMPGLGAAGLAVILFAVDSAHASNVSWLAGRNSLLCMAAALGCLLCHRKHQWYWGLLGYCLFTLSMACAEAALAITGYLFAYELCLSNRRWYVRGFRLLPYALFALVWIRYWQHNGYGVSGPASYSNWPKVPGYIDPIGQPAMFITELPYRATAYLVGQFLLPPSDMFALLALTPVQPWATALIVYGFIASAVLAWFFMPLLRQCAVARFFCIGMLIALIPICAAPVFSRSLWFVGFGATGLLALYLDRCFARASYRVLRKGTMSFALIMMALHLLLHPVLYVADYFVARDISDKRDTRVVGLPDQAGSDQRVLLLSVKSYSDQVSYPLLKDEALSLGSAPSRSSPKISQLFPLAQSESAFDLYRKDADTLVASQPRGFDELRPKEYAFSAGDQLTVGNVQIRVNTVTSEGYPTQIEYSFGDHSLAGYKVMSWDGHRFVSAALPNIGAHAQID